LIRDGHRSSFGLLCIALLFNFAIISFWLRYSRLKICARDTSYRTFSTTHTLLSAALQPLQLLFSFHLFRLLFSRLFRLTPLSSLTLTDKTRIQLKLNRYSLVQLALVHLPVMAASAYNLRWTWPGRQVFWVDCESLGTTAVVACVLVVEVIRSKAMFTVEDKYEESNAVQAMDRTQVVPLQDTTNLTQIVANGPPGDRYR